MEGIVFDLRRYSIYDGPGIRTTVFFKGCPLNCLWCHNPESQKMEQETFVKINKKNLLNLSYSETHEVFGRTVTSEEIMKEIEKDILFYDESGGGATFSGGEPLLQIDFLSDLLNKCRQKGITTAIDTSGCVSTNHFKQIINLTDIFLYDLKIMNEARHIKYTGVSNKLILDNLKYLAGENCRILIRIPLIPNITDTEQNLSEIRDFVNSLPGINQVSLLPFNEIAENKYSRLNKTFLPGNLTTQSEEKLSELAKIFEKSNLEIKIRG